MTLFPATAIDGHAKIFNLILQIEPVRETGKSWGTKQSPHRGTIRSGNILICHPVLIILGPAGESEQRLDFVREDKGRITLYSHF